MADAKSKIIDGKAVAAELRETVAQEVTRLTEHHNLVPGLAVVLVGEDPASQVYVRNKVRQTEAAGMKSFHFDRPPSISQDELLELIDTLNADEQVHGILVQLPLPAHIDEGAVIEAISPDKDVDGFHAINSGRLLNGNARALVACTPRGCIDLAKKALGSDLSGKHAVVVGRSNIVGKPVSILLLQENCTVTIAHSRTQDLAAVCRTADILVAAVGRPEFIQGDWIKPGCTVIDVGINRIERDGQSRLVGDVDFDAAIQHAAAVTPVPGGVGPMTIACLLRNTVIAACNINGLQSQIK
ncbi:bifunctional methylenetetrahydrofolate dehydrogenase/methenyltetrahydrofolate cyclohydrolase FolD [Litorivivens sp.]|uniref:bifunctional methylenetetrahydrofolate dehydrogenase/methenyltetrahydrofolate cyclohydrolase FolD n=1 Tax=Litorivivens sp. TaxID=2020868 RepID=UPI00356293C5